jgi:hypothetical protein
MVFGVPYLAAQGRSVLCTTSQLSLGQKRLKKTPFSETTLAPLAGIVIFPSLSMHDSSGQMISIHKPSCRPDSPAFRFSGDRFAISLSFRIRAFGRKNLNRDVVKLVMVSPPLYPPGSKRLQIFRNYSYRPVKNLLGLLVRNSDRRRLIIHEARVNMVNSVFEERRSGMKTARR